MLSPLDLQKTCLASVAACEGSIDAIWCVGSTERLCSTDVGAGEHLYVRGWSFARTPHIPFDDYFFIVDGKHIFPVAYGAKREDVANAHRGRSIADCGFEVRFPIDMLEPGEHRLTFAGRVRDRFESFGAVCRFRVLATPTVVRELAPVSDLTGRVRSVGETLSDIRHDGRAERAIRRRASLSISGWIAASRDGTPADSVAVTLSGHGRTYRLAAQRREEPEAGVALGVHAAKCGYQTSAAAADFFPGLYSIGVEVESNGVRCSAVTGERVEIMSTEADWLPSALPVYRSPFAGGLREELPERVSSNGEMIVAGWTQAPELVGSIHARFDGESAYALSSGIADGESPAAFGGGHTFVGALAVRLAPGPHELEILALDVSRVAMWNLTRHAFEVVPETPRAHQVQDSVSR